MKFIGIDSACRTGYAFTGCSGPFDYVSNYWVLGTVSADSREKYDVLNHAIENGVTHAVIEEPMPFSGSHAHVAASMNRSYGRWVEACESLGIVVVPARVCHWQPAMLIVNGVRVKQDKKKLASVAVARLLGATLTDRQGDEADAVCLAAYGPRAVARVADEIAKKKVAANAKARARAKSSNRA